MKNRSRGLILSYTYFALNTIIGIFMSGFIIRTIGKTDYGVYQSMTAFVAYLVLLEFGTGTIMARNISLCKKDGSDELDVNKNISTTWSLTIVLSVVILLVSVVFWFLIDGIYKNSMTYAQIMLGKKIFIWAVANLVFSFLTQTLNGLVLGYEYYSFEKSLSLVRLLLRSAVVIVALSIKVDVMLVVIIDTAMSAFIFFTTLLFCIIKIKAKFVFYYFDMGVFRLIAPLALAMLLQTIVNTANGSVDKFLISIMMTPEDVSIYSVSMSMFTMFSSIATLPVSMFMPAIARNMKEGMKDKKLTESLVQPCRMNVIISGLVAFGFLTVGKQFLILIYGQEFIQSWIYAAVVILPMFFNMTNAVIINVIDVLRKRHVRSLILMITTALNIVLTIISIRFWGMFGAAAATGISLLAQTILLNVYYQKKIGINVLFLFHQSYKGILPFFIIAVCVSYPLQYLIVSVTLQFIISGVAFITIFATLYMFWGANEYEKTKFNTVKKKLFWIH